MSNPAYPAPVEALLSLGSPFPTGWPTYADRVGMGEEHIPDLLRLLSSASELWSEGNDEAETWAPLHAAWALTQLGSLEVIPASLAVLDEFMEEDYLHEGLPEMAAHLGADTLPALAEFLADSSHDIWARSTAGEALRTLAQAHPETRDAAIAAILVGLEGYQTADPSLNANLLYSLHQLKAVEAAPRMKEIFDSGQVDEFVAGGWPEYEYELGLTDVKPTRQIHNPFLDIIGLAHEEPFADLPSSSSGNPRKKKKAKRKQQKASRRKNRGR